MRYLSRVSCLGLLSPVSLSRSLLIRDILWNAERYTASVVCGHAS